MPRIPFIWMFIISSLLVVMPSMASAETTEKAPLQMEELIIQVLPEYSYHPDEQKKNDPPLLVSYHGSLKNSSDEPQKGQIEIPVPIEEEGFKIGAVGEYSDDLKEIYDVEYEFDQQSGTISWVASKEIAPQGSYKFIIEYYANSIDVSKGMKSIDYHFKSFADIGQVHIIFMEPLNTDHFELKPEAEFHEKDSYGMNMYSYLVQGMKVGEDKTFQLEYKRNDRQTTEEIMEKITSSGEHPAATVNNSKKLPSWKSIFAAGTFTIVMAMILTIFLRRLSKKSASENKNSALKADTKKAKLRSMLLEGSITQEEYNELVKRLGREKE